MSRRIALVWLLSGLAFPSPAKSQVERYELGHRLRAFETTLGVNATATARRRALDPLMKATNLYFIGQTAEASRHLDLARWALLSDQEPTPLLLWATSLMLNPGTRLADPADGMLSFELDELYPPTNGLPRGSQLTVVLIGPKKPQSSGEFVELLREVPKSGELAIKSLPSGDYRLHHEIIRGEAVLAYGNKTVSLVTDLQDRFDRLRRAISRFAPAPVHTDKETVKSHAEVLQVLKEGKTLETDYPAASMLMEAEEAVAAIRTGRTYFGNRRTGQFRLTLALPDGKQPVRMLAPRAAATGEPLPLVIALHGAKGSENLWFDGYGNGLIARLCEQRGWLLVAPRDGLKPGLLDEVHRLYPVDRRRVFLVGHSIGAAQALGAVSRRPGDFAGVAAFGGGGPVTPSAALQNVAFFVAAGKQDFLAGAAKGLQQALRKAGVKKLDYRELDDVEHLTVVQLALSEALESLDQATKR